MHTSPSKLDTPHSTESDNPVNPEPRMSLSVPLEGTSDVQYEAARDDMPGVRRDEDVESQLWGRI